MLTLLSRENSFLGHVLDHSSYGAFAVRGLTLIGEYLTAACEWKRRPRAVFAAVALAGCLALACSPSAAPPLDGDVLGHQPDNPPPVAVAGLDQTIEEGAEVLLDGSASSDPDGDSLTFSWAQTEGPVVELLDASTAAAHFIAPEVDVTTEFAFTLSVNDGENSATDEVRVTVINLPTPAGADPELVIDASATAGMAPLTVTFDAGTVDGQELPEGTLSWQFGDGTMAEGQQVSHTYLTAGSYVVTLCLALATGTSCAESTVAVSAAAGGGGGVPPPPPAAVPEVWDQAASTPQGVPKSLTLVGSHPNGLNLAFSIVSGPANGSLGTIDNTPLSTAVVVYAPNAGFAGTDTFVFKASDGTNESGNATFTMTVSAVPGTLTVLPATGLSSMGNVGGPFSPATVTYTLSNPGSSSIDWTASKTQDWLSLSKTAGTLAAGASDTVEVSFNAAAESLAASLYSDTVIFTNSTNGSGNTTRSVSLCVGGLPISGNVTRVIAGGGTSAVASLGLTFTGTGSSTGQNFTATTAADGSYTVLVPTGWTGTAAATDPDTWRLTPTNRSFTSVQVAQASQDFCAGRNYYVAITGSDTAAGTLTAPFAAPQKAASIVDPGDTVYFREGTYFETTSSRRAVPVMEVLRSGTDGHPITFKNYAQEVVIFSGSIPSIPGDMKYEAIMTGEYPSDQSDASGSGVHHVLLEGLVFESTRRTGILVCGPAAMAGFVLPSAPASFITVRKCVSRGGLGRGIATRGRCEHIIIELCEACSHAETAIMFCRLSKAYDVGLPEDSLNGASYSTIRDCLSYNNSNPITPGNTDGLGGSHTWRCAFKDNVVFGNSDDGIDIYASMEATVSGNIVFDHNHPDGNGCGFKVNAGGGGRHTVLRNIALNNKAWAFEASNPSNPLLPYCANNFYNNLAYANGRFAFSLGSDIVTGTFVLRNNIAHAGLTQDYRIYDSSVTDSDYNFMRESDLLAAQAGGDDSHSLHGDPGFSNPGTDIDTTFVASWSIEQRLEHVRSQVRARFTLKASSPCIDAGADVGLPFLGNAPDMGPYEAE